MFITPITKINSISELNSLKNTQEIGNQEQIIPFKSVFENALNDYKEAEIAVNIDIYDLTVGNSDDLHNLMINMRNSEMAFELFVQLRNKAVEVYKELLNTSM